MAIKPFWRFAVLPRHLTPDAAIASPYYTQRGAYERIDDWFTDLGPSASAVDVYRKRFFRRVELVETWTHSPFTE